MSLEYKSTAAVWYPDVPDPNRLPLPDPVVPPGERWNMVGATSAHVNQSHSYHVHLVWFWAREAEG